VPLAGIKQGDGITRRPLLSPCLIVYLPRVIEELHGCMPLAASDCVRTVKLPVLPLARLTVPVKPAALQVDSASL
jgi:hypothetical protein